MSKRLDAIVAAHVAAGGKVTTGGTPPRFGKRPWSNAVPSHCLSDHNHPSKMEARVCDRLTAEVAGNWREKEVLFRQVRLPLLSIAPESDDKPMYFSVDFAIVRGGKLHRLIDAKAKGRVSRDWRRGKAACEACYGITVEEVDK